MQDIPTLLFFWPGQFVYVGQALDTRIHSHHAVQLIVSLTTPFRMRRPGGEWGSYRTLLIDSDQPHECRALNSHVLFCNIDPETEVGRQLKHTFLTHQSVAELPPSRTDELIAQLASHVLQATTHDQLRDQIAQFVDSLSNYRQPTPIDERIEKALGLLQLFGDKPPKLRELADEVCLSSGRLVHLFKEQVGIPIRKYILWKRMLNAVHYMTTGATLTTAAHEAGFADSAHFSRTFSRMFGMMPSAITKNSQFIQVYVWG